MLQESAFADDDYQAWRSELVGTCFAQIQELNTELIAVRLRMQSVEKFKKPGAFNYISEGDKGELLQQIAPIVPLQGVGVVVLALVRADQTGCDVGAVVGDALHIVQHIQEHHAGINGADAVIQICAETAA